MKKILTAAFMVAALAACSQETKQETKEAAQAVASDVKDAKADAASAVDAAAVAAKEAGAKAADATKEAGEKAVDATKEAGEKAVDATKAAGEKAADATKNVAEDAVAAAKEAAEKAKEAVYSTTIFGKRPLKSLPISATFKRHLPSGLLVHFGNGGFFLCKSAPCPHPWLRGWAGLKAVAPTKARPICRPRCLPPSLPKIASAWPQLAANVHGHVFNNAQNRNVDFWQTCPRLCGIKQGDVLWRGDHHRCGDGDFLRQRQLNVACAGRQIDEQIIHIVPLALKQQLLQGLADHGATPHHGLVGVYQKADRHGLNAAFRHHGNEFAVALFGFQIGHAQHGGLAGAVNVGIEHAHARAHFAQGNGQIGGGGGFAHAAFARSHGDDVFHAFAMVFRLPCCHFVSCKAV
jgi:hypothetical protein